MRLSSFFLLIIIIVFGQACHVQGKAHETTVAVHIKYAHKKKIYLERLALPGEKSEIIDSATAYGEEDSLVFHIHDTDERLYSLNAMEVNMHIVFVNDAPVIDIYTNYARPDQFTFKNSPGSTALKNFIIRQTALAEKTRQTAAILDSLKKNKAPLSGYKKWQNNLDSQLVFIATQYRHFEDTVHSAGAFLAVYNNLDFGKDLTGLKQFIVHAAARFPSNHLIQKLKAKTLDYVMIFEKEYRAGDTLPSITLPSTDGMFSTASLQGKYYLIDFWASWCKPCFYYFPVKQQLMERFSPDSLAVVSVAVDSEKEIWRKIAADPKFRWRQLIDTAMWEGPAVRALLFDSIPFNFLVSPGGVVLRSGLPPDSILPVISRYIKPVQKK